MLMAPCCPGRRCERGLRDPADTLVISLSGKPMCYLAAGRAELTTFADADRDAIEKALPDARARSCRCSAAARCVSTGSTAHPVLSGIPRFS
jgi:hypothetical protein